MLVILQVTSFKRDMKRISRGRFDLPKLDVVVKKLAKHERLEAKYSDHLLTGNWRGHRECHLAPDWLLIYRVEGNILKLIRTGSHSELF